MELLRLYRAIALMGFFVVASAWGQAIVLRGTITAADGQTIPGASVQWTGTLIGTSTDQLGRYRLELPKPDAYSLRFSSLGSGTVEMVVELTADRELRIVLPDAPVELREVAVTNDRGASPMTTFGQLDMRTRPVNSSQDLLRLVPGLFIAQHAGGGKAEQIFFRGFDVDHGTDLRISVDGMPVNMVSHAHGQGYADLHFTIPETMERISVHKGPYDARSGDFATSGTVEFHTRNAIESNEVKAEIGYFNTMRVVGLFDLLGKKHLLSDRKESAYVAGEYAFTDAYFNQKQDFGRTNLFGKYTGQIGDRSQLTVSASNFHAAWDASGQIPQRAVDNGTIGRFGSIDPNEGGNTSRTNVYATMVNGLRNGSSFKNQIYYVRYDFRLFSDFTFYANDPVRGDMIAQTDHRNIMGYTGSHSRSARLGGMPLRYEMGVGLRHDAADIALQNAEERVIYDTLVAGHVDQWNANGYFDATLDVTDRLRVNAALRTDVFRFDYSDVHSDLFSGTAVQQRISPKLNINYAWTERTQVYVRTGMGFHSNDARAVVVNGAGRTLPRAYGTDLGSTFKPMPRMLMDIALWTLYLESELIYVGDGGVVETNNPTRRTGIDLSIRYQLTTHLFADLDLDLSHGRLIGPPSGENAIPLAPRFTSVGGLAYKKDKGFNASVRYRHIADRPANESNSVVAQGYFLVDALLSYRFTKLELGASVENIFNVEWNQAQFDTTSRLPGESEAVSELHFTPGTPFFLKGSVSFRF